LLFLDLEDPRWVKIRIQDKHPGSATLAVGFVGDFLFFVQVYKEDLDLKNHLVGLKQLYLKLEFLTVPDMTRVSGPGNEK